MAAMFNVPAPVAKSGEVAWESMDLASLPKVLAEQVTNIHAAEEQIKAMKKSFAEDFNNAYSEAVPAGMIRRFSFKFDGLSFGNVVPTGKNGKSKVTFTAKKGK